MKALDLKLYSFGYRRSGIPNDSSEHGGGFVFDCRCLPNPGRFQEYKKHTGRDASVQEWLEAMPETHEFLQGCTKLVKQSIAAYQKRGFTHLMVSFGCTGGQHRSVYMAEHLKLHLDSVSELSLTLEHLEQSYWHEFA